MLLQTQQRLARRARGHPAPAARPAQSQHQRHARGRGALAVRASVVPPGSTVLVAGATGGVGQLVTAKLLDRGYKVVALARDPPKAQALLGKLSGASSDTLEVVQADARDRDSLARAFAGREIDAVVCTTGTTAFPSDRWRGNNGPRPTDLDATLHLINSCPRSLKRFLLVTSAGVERQSQFPWLVLNLYGVLTFKRAAEIALEESGLPWSVLRPSRLVDGPYTSFDLNTLLKATSESQGLKGVMMVEGDSLKGQASRVAVAEACVQALGSAAAEGKAFAIESVAPGSEGGGGGAEPGADASKWEALFLGRGG